MNITDPVRRQALESPETVAVIRGSGIVTYRELNRAVDALAARLAGLGLRAGDAAGVLMHSRYGRLVLTLALARIGAAAATVNSAGEKLDGITLKTCFVDDAAAAGVRAADGGAADRVTVDNAWWRTPAATQEVPAAPSHPDGAATCLIVRSSGTTGVAKAIALSHDVLGARVRARTRAIRFPERQRQLCMLGLGLNYGFYSVLQTLWSGGLTTLAIKGSVHDAIQLYQLNCMVMSPAQLHGVLNAMPEGAGPFPSLEIVEIGGSILAARLASLARERLCANIYVAYGAAESGITAGAPVAALADHPGGAGFIAPGVEVQAVDADDRPLPAGSEGTIRIRSAHCVSAYLGDAAASARTFRDGWFYPGDTGSVSDQGLLTIAGRSDELINAGGAKVSPQVIEDAALLHPDVSEAAAFAVPNAATGVHEIWLAVVVKKPVDGEALRAFCIERLGSSKAPWSILAVKELPRNDNGKVLRSRLVKSAEALRKIAASKKT